MIKALLETKCGCTQVIEIPMLKPGVDVLIPGYPSYYRTFELRSGEKDGMLHYVEAKTGRVKSIEELEADAERRMAERHKDATY
jgi:hypothetical protein